MTTMSREEIEQKRALESRRSDEEEERRALREHLEAMRAKQGPLSSPLFLDESPIDDLEEEVAWQEAWTLARLRAASGPASPNEERQ